MEFIAVAGHQQPPAGMDLPSDGDQTHAGDFRSPRNRPPEVLISSMNEIFGVHISSTALNPASISKFETKQHLVDNL
jgi:hypothetical protein